MAHCGAWQLDWAPLPCEEEELLSAADALRSDDDDDDDACVPVPAPKAECPAAGEAHVPARAEALRCLEPSHGAECEWCAPPVCAKTRGRRVCVGLVGR
jgi:hypothetical protein